MPIREELPARARAFTYRMRGSFVDAKPQHFDCGEGRFDEDGEVRWSSIEAVECDDCGQYIVEGDDHAFIGPDGEPVPGAALIGDDDIHEDELVEWAEANGYSTCPRQGEGYTDFDIAEGPMMNYIYPIDDDDYSVENARKLAGLPLCLVRMEDDDSAFLALTGGGMDLSWEICEAYIRLGYYPPSHFELPEMAGKQLTERNARILIAVTQSNIILHDWAERRRERAEKLLSTLPLPNEEN